jgi:hypothetical protein
MNANIVEQRLIEKIRKLSSTRIIEIENFIDFLSEREDRSDANLFTVGWVEPRNPTSLRCWCGSWVSLSLNPTYGFSWF